PHDAPLSVTSIGTSTRHVKCRLLGPGAGALGEQVCCAVHDDLAGTTSPRREAIAADENHGAATNLTHQQLGRRSNLVGDRNHAHAHHATVVVWLPPIVD